MSQANPASTGNPTGGNPAQAPGSSGEQEAPLSTNLADDPNFRAWQSAQDKQTAALQQQLTRAEQARDALEGRLGGLLHTLQEAPDGAALGEVAEQASAEFANMRTQRAEQAFAAQGTILQHVQQGVPIAVFDSLLQGSTPPSPTDIAHACTAHYEAQGEQARANAEAEIRALRDQALQEIQTLRANSGLDSLHGGRAMGGDPSSLEVMQRQYQERLTAIPASQRQRRINLRREFRRRGLDI